ncbi:MAG: protoporphyrinogen oxidase [Elusimicrobiota bacterium]|nr:protoporphyrinogen oxidase [Elusimicrobiota bacterium]
MRPGRPPATKRVVVLGGGISGLVAAYELVKRGAPIEVTVLEASKTLGGKIRTESIDGQIFETGPDSFLTTKPEMLELVRELGLANELIGTGPDAGVDILLGGRLVPMPAGMNLVAPTRLLPFLLTPLFSPAAKLHMALEPLRPSRGDGKDESLADFARRRLGAEALERLVAPMLAGIYAGDPERMSVASTFPQLLDMEKRGGLVKSMWLGWLGTKRAARRDGLTTFMTLKGGLSMVVDALQRRLPPRSVRLDTPAQAVRRREGHWEVVTPNAVIEADAVISALPAYTFADCIEGIDPELAVRLREIPFSSTATSVLIYDDKDIPVKPKGFGFLAPKGEGLTVTAATYSSAKFPGRAIPGRTTVRAFIGGAGRDADAEGAITRLESRVRGDIDKVLALKGAKPAAMKTTRWIKTNPQYEVGHARRLDRLGSCLKGHQGLILAGASYGGVGLPDCVRSGRRAAELVFAGSRRSHDAVRPGLA